MAKNTRSNAAGNTDWLKVGLHFFFGAVLGGALGAGAWLYWTEAESGKTAVGFITGGAILLGVLAAIFLDDFWENLKHFIDWP